MQERLRLAILEKESTDINGALFTTISIPVVTTIPQHINSYLIQSHDVYTSLRSFPHETVVALFQQIRAEHCSRTVYVLNLEKLYCFVCPVISRITHNKTSSNYQELDTVRLLITFPPNVSLKTLCFGGKRKTYVIIILEI